ncbi:sel1 repeat family protein (plasmid) [Streptomyces anulatus]|uniref:tetratricopeptide repeat protein n=1 Tax=Streptomyces anulatus TaxID=1892 RepID=UPI002DDC4E64|nr:tetratricopeptide repeat protein [Streptomyces anulatus]WSC66793.1 sel1 repeat family protein [Streptomyces anulatus]
MAGTITGPVTFTTAGKHVPVYLQDPLRWPLAGGWDALAAGTHRSRPDDFGDAVPPYVPRDQDAVIRTRLTRAAHEGGLVLVVGDSTAGKTRACFEALRAELPEYRVVAPAGGADLLTAVEVIDRTAVRCVVWLDDLESCLGPDGLEPGLLAELIRLRIPVLATMRHQQFEIFAAPETTSEMGTEHARTATAGARVLRQLDPVELNRIWTPGELERAGEGEDDRIADALAHHGTYGIAEYLAAGPALLQEWRRAHRPGGHPRAAALIAAAVDLARTGLRPPYSHDILTSAHEPYLTAAGGPLLRPEPLDLALEWATRRRHGVTSMLVPTQDPNAWDVFDYLTDHTHTSVPDITWHTALQHTTDPDELTTLGYHAHEAAPVIAEVFYRQAVDAGNVIAGFNLGLLLAEAGRADEAEGFYRRAAEAGHCGAMVNLGNLLADVGLADEAESFYRQAADAGDAIAMYGLGVLLAEAGRTDEAEGFYRQAVDAGYSGAVVNLGLLLERAGRADEAESLYCQAVDAGDATAMYGLGVLLAEAGRTDEAEGFYQQAVDAGHRSSMVNLGNLLVGMGREDEAETLYRQAVDAGHSRAMFNLGLLLERTSRTDEAESLYRQAVDAGHRSSMVNLGVLLSEAGRTDEAEGFYRQAAEAGHSSGMFNLGNRLAEAGRTDEAESFYRQAAEAGHSSSMFNLGVLLERAGRTDEAESLYRRAADAGNSDAMVNLGNLVAEADRTDEA